MAEKNSEQDHRFAASEYQAVARLREYHFSSLGLGELIAHFAKKDLGLEVSHQQYLDARMRREVIADFERAAAAVASSGA